jgi:hypothetical protein
MAIQMHEKTEEEIAYSEKKEVSGTIGEIKVDVFGMRGFWGCLIFCVICLAVGVPILVMATFQDQYEVYSCSRGPKVDLAPCDTTADTAEYFCPIAVTLACGEDFPAGCTVQHNTTVLSEAEQLEWCVRWWLVDWLVG